MATLGVPSISLFASFIASLTSLRLDIGLGRHRVEDFLSSISIGIYKVSCMVPRWVSGRWRLRPRHRRVPSPRLGILSSQDACLVPLESTDGLWQPSERLLDPLGAHLRTSSSFVLFFGVISLLVLAFDLHLFLRLGLSLSLSLSPSCSLFLSSRRVRAPCIFGRYE